MKNQTDFHNFSSKYITALTCVLDNLSVSTQDASSPISQAVECIESARYWEHTVWLIGDGGAASLADHMAVDLQLAGVRAISLTSSTAITTIGNDQCFEQTFSLQLDRLANSGDTLIAISTSGASPNIRTAIETARELKMHVIALMGPKFTCPKLPTDAWTPKSTSNILIPLVLPATNRSKNATGIRQDYAEVVLHLIAYYLLEQMG